MQKCGKNEETPAEKMRVSETKRVKERERGRESGDEKGFLNESIENEVHQSTQTIINTLLLLLSHSQIKHNTISTLDFSD